MKRFKVFCRGVGVMYYWRNKAKQAMRAASADGYNPIKAFRG